MCWAIFNFSFAIPMIVYGINPVLEALRSNRVVRLRIGSRADTRDSRIDEALTLASEHSIAVERVDARALDRIARGGVHQGIVADLEAPRDYSIRELIAAARSEPPLIVVLDGIEDPHNVGAIVRTADAAGAHGVVRQTRHSAALGGAVAKASAGAIAHMRVATVVNIARAVQELRDSGVWTIGLAGEAADPYVHVDFTLPSAVVLGAEGVGLRRLVRDRCDRLVSIPMRGAVSSLNVSVAAGVTLFEAVRQRNHARQRAVETPR
jgi:23S rRNA (guanosine2251-2'-O)-methyltransferase